MMMMMIPTTPYKSKLLQEPILIEDNGCLYMINKDGIATLQLPDGKQRNIGFLTKDRDGIVEYHITRNPEIHLFHKLDAYGINHRIMIAFDPDVVVFYIVNKGTSTKNIYYIDRNTYLKYATFLHFKQQNFELQRFIKVIHLKPHYAAKEQPYNIV